MKVSVSNGLSGIGFPTDILFDPLHDLCSGPFMGEYIVAAGRAAGCVTFRIGTHGLEPVEQLFERGDAAGAAGLDQFARFLEFFMAYETRVFFS